MDNQQKLTIYGTQNKDKQSKNTTQYVLATQTNTNNVNKTWALLHTTGGKDEQNIDFIRISQRTSQKMSLHDISATTMRSLPPSHCYS